MGSQRVGHERVTNTHAWKKLSPNSTDPFIIDENYDLELPISDFVVYFWSSGRWVFLTVWKLIVMSPHKAGACLEDHVIHFLILLWGYASSLFLVLTWWPDSKMNFSERESPLTLFSFSEFGKTPLPRWFCCGRSRPRDFSSAPLSMDGVWPSCRLLGA